MDLEVISRKPRGGGATRRHAVPLLFVHGAYGGAWVWEPHFLPFFAEQGYAAHAVSLRGHGGSDGWSQLAFARLADYVDDVVQVAEGLDRPPVVIGHSMGGMVVQKYLHRCRGAVPGAVLMASVPPHGLLGSAVTMSLSRPHLMVQLARMQTFGPWLADVEMVREALFSDDTPDHVIRSYLPKLQPESALVLADLFGLDLPPSLPILDLPVLVLGAEGDAFISRGAVEATADTYRTRPEIFPGMAHAMMLDHFWERSARRILSWLEQTISGER